MPVLSDESDRSSRVSEPIIIQHNPSSISRYQSIERRMPPSLASMKSFSFDFSNDVPLAEPSAPAREKTKFFEHTHQHKLSTGRENYV